MKIFAEEEVLNCSLVREIFEKFPVEVISSYQDFFWGYKSFPELVSQGKDFLFFLKYKGRFFRKCPGTKNYFCCGYKIFHFGEGCPLDCTYCILQLYLNRPGLKIWGNLIEDGFFELASVLEEHKNKGEVLRIGTGEFADSLALEHIAGVSKKLIYFWKEKNPLAVLELKTKVFLDKTFFEKLPPDPRIIFAWSVNTEKVIKEEEKKAPSLKARLKSAKYAIERGFTVAFHFDPIIFYPEATEEYPRVLEEILNEVPAERIAWISLGTLRYPPELKQIAEARFPETKIYAEEFIDGLDKKKRYFIDLRRELYLSLKKLIKSVEGEVVFYFCMERERMWKEVLEKEVRSSEDVKKMLDESALKLCKLSEKW